MKIKQLSVFLENSSGRLTEVTKLLSEANINLSAFTVADTAEFGILRMIVSEPERAKEVLKQNGFSIKITEVIMVKSPNKPGGLAKLLEILSNGGVFMEYMYAFSMNDQGAVIVMRPSDIQKGVDILLKHGTELLTADDQYQL